MIEEAAYEKIILDTFFSQSLNRILGSKADISASRSHFYILPVFLPGRALLCQRKPNIYQLLMMDPAHQFIKQKHM